MKPTLIALTLFVSQNLMAAALKLPATMDAGSVQAKLKNVLYQKLEADGPMTEEYSAKLTGNYGEVTLEDDNARITCREFSAGMLAVQQFECEIVDYRSRTTRRDHKVSLPQVMDAASVQAIVKGLLYEKLEKEGPTTSPYEASLTGDYSEVTLEDENAKVVCREHSAGMLAVQTFGCDFIEK